jgi:hypothetical protein
VLIWAKHLNTCFILNIYILVLKMAKEKQRKSILVSEACFNNFNEVRNSLNKNSSETLTALMQKEIIKTETLIVNQNRVNNRLECNNKLENSIECDDKLGNSIECDGSTTFSNCVNQLNRKNNENNGSD